VHSIEIRPDRIVVVCDAAAERRLRGWRMVSSDSQVLGFTGSAGNLLFNTGGGNAIERRYTVLYEQAEPISP